MLLGAVTAAPGPERTVRLPIADDVPTDAGWVTATTTALDTATPSGFGSTSELSGAVPLAAP